MTRQFDHPPRPFRKANSSSKGGAKRAVNVSVDAGILVAAKSLGINLSSVLEGELRRLTDAERARRFAEENKDWFETYNAYIARNGVFGEEFQDWDEPV